MRLGNGVWYMNYALPAFRFRYSEEKVAKDPTSMPRYAKGTARPSQSTMLADGV